MLSVLFLGLASAAALDADRDGYDASADCNDRRADIHPGATEVCDGADQNCDGVVDEGVQITWFHDGDGDGYGTAQARLGCGLGANRVDRSGDCRDADPSAHPGATEVCDGVDQDCNRKVDDGVQNVYFRDDDLDGYGSAATIRACTSGPGRVTVGGDCQDEDEAIRPDAVEVCDGLDQNCNGVPDDDLTSVWYPDVDQDGYGDASTAPLLACEAPTGWILDGSDCDDNDEMSWPAAPEITDGADNDCNGLVDDLVVDLPFQIIIAGNFLGLGDCQESSADGCDLYRVQFDAGTWDISAVDQLTATPRQGEIWPSIDRTGTTLAYETQIGPRAGDLTVLDLATGVTQTIGPARYPAFAYTRDLLAYSDDDWQVHLLEYSSEDGVFSILGDQSLTSGRDPEFFPDDAALLFHDQPDGEETRTVLYDRETATRADWSDADGCAHASVNEAGTLAICQDGTIIKGRTFDGVEWGPYQEIARPGLPTEYGTRYTRCELATFSYPYFCGGGNNIAVSLNCVQGGVVTDSSIVVIDLDTGAVVDLHDDIQTFLHVRYSSSRTVACTRR